MSKKIDIEKKNYNKNVVIAIICDFVSFFILGYIFSGIAYSLFNKNYKNSLNSKQKRNKSIIGKAVSSFFFFMSVSYHGQSMNISSDEKIITSSFVGLIGAIICFIVLKIKDKNIPLIEEKNNKNTKEKIIDFEFECSNCGTKLSKNATKCPKCKEKFIKDNIDTHAKKEIDTNTSTKEELFKCDNCGTIVKESTKKCPGCGEKFEDDIKNIYYSDIDKKYSDLNKLKKLLDDKIITKEEFNIEKKKILNQKK